MNKDLLFRSATVEDTSIDIEGRRVAVAFSSEAPNQRSFGVEILSHRSEDVDMSFLASGSAPLLLEHDREDQIGIVESAQIESGVGRAVVRFSKSADGEAIWQDVVDGIRKNISVGYVVTDKQIEKRAEGQVVICKWTPMEISIVSIPADQTVGVGRAAELTAETNENNNNKETQMENQEKEVLDTRAVDIEVIRNDVMKAERTRAAEINALATRHNVQSVGNEFIASGKSVDEFRAAVLDTLSARPTVQTQATIGMSDKEVRSYSLSRAINAIVTGDFSDAGLEYEASKEVAKANGKVQTRSSIFVPGEYLTRAAGANAVSVAGQPALVNTTKVGFMDVLFAQTIAQKLGVQYMTGLNGVIELPKFTSAVQARFVDEGQDGTPDAITSNFVELKPRTLISMAELTRSMILNGTAVEARVMAQIQKVMSVAIDKAVFDAIVAEAAIAWKTNPTALDYASLRALILEVELNNALSDSCKFAFDPSIGNALSTTEQDSNTVGIYLRNASNQVAGYGSESAVHVGNNMIFGDFSNVTVGNWGTLELAVDTSQKFASGGFLLRAITDLDVAVTRPEAFAGYKALI